MKNHQACAAAFVLTRCHGLDVHEQIVKPSGAGETRREGRGEHALRRIQARLGALQGQVLDKLFWAQPDPATE